MGGGGSYPSAEEHSVYSTVPADWPTIDKTLLGAITPSHSGPGSNGNEGVLQSSRTSPSGYLIVGWESYPSAEMQSVCSIAPVNWAALPME